MTKIDCTLNLIGQYLTFDSYDEMIKTAPPYNNSLTVGYLKDSQEMYVWDTDHSKWLQYIYQALPPLDKAVNPEIKALIQKLEELKNKAHPDLLKSCSANIPFYVEIKKPRESLSKHDATRPTYWHCDDGVYLAALVAEVPKLIEEIRRLTDE